MEKNTLLKLNGYWEASGLLLTIPDDKKSNISIKLDEVRKFLLERNGGDEVETIAFPVVIRAFKKNEDFDAVSLIKEFINDFKKADLEAEFICNWIEYKFKI